MIIKQFNLLTPAELIIAQEHLKLGIDHLKQHLSCNELKRLLRSLPLQSKLMNTLETGHTEIVSNLSLVLNTILTATFGAWMGYSAILGIGLGSLGIFSFIIALAAGTGAIIGYINVHITKMRAQAAIDNQKLHLLQLEILRNIEEKRKQEFRDIFCEINDVFVNLKTGTSLENKALSLEYMGKSPQHMAECLNTITYVSCEKLAKLVDKSEYSTYQNEVMALLKDMKKTAKSFFCKRDSLEGIHDDSPKLDSLDPILKKLITTSPKESFNILSWVQANLQALLIGLVPTLLGGFSSLSVYWGGVPNILKQFDKEDLFLFFTSPYVRSFEITTSLLITLYFAFSYIYINRKAFKRSQELENTNRSIVKKESSLTVLDADRMRLQELKRSFLELKRFFRLLSLKKRPLKIFRLHTFSKDR